MLLLVAEALIWAKSASVGRVKFSIIEENER